MIPIQARIRIESEILSRMEKRYSEEEQANHLMSLLLDNYPLHSAVVLAFDEGKSPLVVAHRGLSGNFIKDLYAKGTLPVIDAAASGEIVIGGDDPRLSDPAWRLEHECRSIYAAPCRIQGETVGVFLADSGQADLFAGETRNAFLRYAQLCAILLLLRTYRGKAARVPDIDPVTGLRGFKFFHEVLHREMMRGKKFRHPVSILFIKVRFLREMNEVHGHVAADHALVAFVEAVRRCVREVDFVTRTGSMIHIVMPQMEKGEASKVAETIREAVDASRPGRGGVVLKAAIGVVSCPKDGDTERVLLPHVESMVHESARKGGSAVTVFRD